MVLDLLFLLAVVAAAVVVAAAAAVPEYKQYTDRHAQTTLTQAPALFTFRLARNVRAYASASARSTGFCAIWDCDSPSSSSTGIDP